MGKVINNFFKLVQPTIVKTSEEEELPERLRNRFFLNLNILGIKYFEQNFLVTESDEGIPYMIATEECFNILIENGDSDYENVFDIPRIYIDITEKFVNDAKSFRNFLYEAIIENAIYLNGYEDFLPGQDYWLNKTLYDYLSTPDTDSSICLPNFLTNKVEISRYFVDLSETFMEDYTNLDYYEKKNRQLDFKFSEDELLNFYSTFCKYILDNTSIEDDVKLSGNNSLYEIVLKYFANFKTDEASTAMNIVLNGIYSSAQSANKSCTCNSSMLTNNLTSNDIYTKTCSSLYHDAMDLYLKQMLGDVQFYKDWMNIHISDHECVVNDILVEGLIQMINEFIEMDLFIDSSDNNNVHSSWTCGSGLSIINSNASANNKVLSNYLKVLDFVYNNNFVQNTNKIKIWGEAFGELLPTLQF